MSMRIIGSGGGKGGSGAGGVSESPDTLASVTTASFVDLISEGEIVGLVNNDYSIYMDGVPLKTIVSDTTLGAYAFDNRQGAQGQTVMSGFSGTQSEISVNSLKILATQGKVIRAVTDADADSVRFNVSVHGLYQTTSDGKVTGSSVNFRLWKRITGGAWVSVREETITGKTTSNYQRSIEVDLNSLGAGPYEIAIERIKDDSASGLLVDALYWDSYTVINYEQLRYPNSALVGVRINAQYFSSIPARTYHVKGLLVKVPDNYDPVTRVYRTTGAGTTNGAWNGAMNQVAYTDNPAWCYFDLMTSSRYGLGELIDASKIDKWALYQIAQYCDQLVPTGLTLNVFGPKGSAGVTSSGQPMAGVPLTVGNSERRFRLNCVLNTRDDAYRVLNQLTSVFWGMAYWGSNSVTLTQDRPTAPSMLYTNANVEGGLFTYEGSAKSQRNTVAIVGWNDPAEDFKQKFEYVEDRDGIARYGLRSTDVVAFGCTSRSQARRMGLWLLYTQRLETEMISFKVGQDSAFVRPGAVIKIKDNDYAGIRWGGRVTSCTTTRLEFDSTVDFPVGTHTCTIIQPNGTPYAFQFLSNGTAGATGINLSTPFTASQQPIVGAVWMVETSSLAARLARVVSTRHDGIGYRITALEHDPGKYAAIESGAGYEKYNYTVISYDSVPPVTGLAAVESTFIPTGTRDFTSRLEISCDAINSSQVRGYIFDVTGSDGSGYTFPETSSPTATLENAQPITYTITAKAVNSLGIAGAKVAIVKTVLAIDQRNPPSAIGLAVTTEFANFIISWTAQTYPEGGGHKKVSVYASTTNLFTNAVLVGDSEGNSLTYASAPSKTLYFFLRNTSVNGQKQVTATGPVSATTATIASAQNTQVYLYRWSVSQPAKPAGISTYTWSSSTHSGYTGVDGWSTTIPPNTGVSGLQLWASQIRVSAASDSASINIDWTASASAVMLASISANATAVSAIVTTVYQSSASQPTTPTGGSYEFSTGVLTPPSGGWLTLNPGTSSNPVWASSQVFRTNYVDATVFADTSSGTSTILHFDGVNAATTTGDSGLAARTVSLVNATLSTTRSFFGGSSLKLSGTGYADVTVAAGQSGDFTLRGKFFITSSDGTNQAFFTVGALTDGFELYRRTNANNNVIGLYSGSAANLVLGQGTTSLPINQWLDIEWTRASGVHRVWLDGVLQFSYTQGTAMVFGTNIRIGGYNGTTEFFNGNVDEVYISTTSALHNTSANFTPPTATTTAATAWSMPVKFGENGATGQSSVTVNAYKVSSAQPATPSGGTYNVASGLLTLTGWSKDYPGSTSGTVWQTSQTFTTNTPAIDVAGGNLDAKYSIYHLENSTLDEAGALRTMTLAGAAALSTVRAAVGTSSLFTGANGYATVAISGTNTGDFTLRGKFFISDTSSQNRALISTGGSNAMELYRRSDTGGNALTVYDSLTAANIGTGAAVPANAWVDIEWTRAAGVHRIYMDGVFRFTFTNNAATDLGPIVRFGAPATPGDYLNGYVDEVLVCVGVALHNTTTTFSVQNTPQVAPVASGSNAAWTYPVVAPTGFSVTSINIYATAASQPALPTGGSYLFSTDTLTPPSGWSRTNPGVASGPIWVSSQSFKTATPDVSVASTAWTAAVRLSTDGLAGQRGSVEASRLITGTTWSDSEAVLALSAAGYATPVKLDRVTEYNAAGSFSQSKYFDGTSWLTWSMLINGNLLVTGSIGANKLAVTSLSSIAADLGTITAGTLTAGTVFAGALSAATGTFSGSLTAATGTFAGSLSAATGSFAGALNAATGSFAGSLTAVTGTFQSLEFATNGYLRSGQTAFDTGTGVWLGVVSGVPKFSIGGPTSALLWDGTSLTLRNASFETFSVSIAGGDIFGPAVSRTATASGGKAPYAYNWVFTPSSQYAGQVVYITESGTATATAHAQTNADGSFSGVLTCMVRDSNNRVSWASVNIAVSITAGGGL